MTRPECVDVRATLSRARSSSKGSGSQKLKGSPRKDHNQTRVCRVACAQAGLCPKRGEGSGSRKLMGSPGGITTRHEFAELACTDRHGEAGSRLRAHMCSHDVLGSCQPHGVQPKCERALSHNSSSGSFRKSAAGRGCTTPEEFRATTEGTSARHDYETEPC